MSEATPNQDPKPLSDEELAAAAAMTATDPLADICFTANTGRATGTASHVDLDQK